ncbi:protein kinase [Microbotryomycetes sp. JL221]|nr:protein kinase [Microbotryomycetes sp. JL221]
MSALGVVDTSSSTQAPTTDISTIELHKENIQPLTSGRSASQLASLQTQTRQGLGNKLALEHKAFQAKLDAIDEYERTNGEWEPPTAATGGTSDDNDTSTTTLTLEDVQHLVEDPLDVHHQYARFVVANYPAGNSAVSRLVPVLEQATRSFVNDQRYQNDPRYLRLWNLYAKHTVDAEDCYKFLFAKQIGDKLATLYEEFALVLENKGRTTEADKVYTLGIHRKAMPLDRLKRRYKEFQERMLNAPPPGTISQPSSPARQASASSSGARPILGGAGASSSTRPQPAIAKSSSATNGASAFAIFRDTSGSASHSEGSQWDDLGTVKSRRRENEQEATAWKGETLPMSGHATSRSAFKLEVFRDADAPTPATSHHDASTGDVFTRSIRGPSEVESLRNNPLKNFSSQDQELLATFDPLAGLENLPPVSTTTESNQPSTAVASGARAKASSSSSSSSRKSGSTRMKKDDKAISSSSANVKPTSERTAVVLSAVYPAPGVEYSFEELMMMRRQKEMGNAFDSWHAWEHRAAYEHEIERAAITTYFIDPVTTFPLLEHPVSGDTLFDFARPPPSPPTPAITEMHDSPVRALARQDNDGRASPASTDESPNEATSTASSSTHSSPQRSEPHRAPPSPTINTRLAADMVDQLFAKTLDFGKVDGGHGRDSDDDEDSDRSTDEDDDEAENRPAWADMPLSQLNQASQASTQLSASGGPGPSQTDDAPFVPFSQASTTLDDISFRPSSQQDHENALRLTYDENGRPIAFEDEKPMSASASEPLIHSAAPAMQLHRDQTPATPAALAGGFRPVKRAPLGIKPLGFGADSSSSAKPVKQLSSSLSVFRDDEVAETNEPSEADDSFEDYEAPLRGGEEEDEGESGRPAIGDGFAMGRREKGVPSRYAPFIDAMTPVKEATMEYTTMSSYNMTTSLSTSQRSSRRESAFPPALTVEEEDEDEEGDNDSDEEEEDEEADADRAFVVYEAEESDRSTRRSSDSEDDESDEEETPVSVPFLAPVAQIEQVSPASEDPSWSQHESTRKDSQFDGVNTRDSNTVDGTPSTDPSFETFLASTSLPDGLTIEGNQSGMTTGMVLADTTNLPQDDSDQALGTKPQSSIVPVNPFLNVTIEALIASLSPPVLQHSQIRNLTHQTADNLASLQKTAKRRQSRRSSGRGDKTGVIEDAWEVQLGSDMFSVREKLGEGAFGSVFRMAAPADPDKSFDIDAEDDESALAVKVQHPTNLWEFVVLDRIRQRLDERTSRAIVKADKLYAFQDESYLLLEFCDQGSLLDAVNKANEAGVAPATGGVGQGLDELVAMFFVIELARTIERMHEAGFVHGDIKIDNCLVRFEDVPGGTRAWSTTYDPQGSNGWSSKGVKLIDFGRAIDTRMFPSGQRFVSDFHLQPQDPAHQTLADCPEMRTGAPWTYEPDYYGLASIAFNLLFGKYMETIKDDTGRWTISQPFRRYHQAELWSKLFDVLLNPTLVKPTGALPITDELGQVRREMEGWLTKNCDRNGKSLKSLIKKMEIYAMSR